MSKGGGRQVGFAAMRRSLIERGWLDEQHQLTDAGRAATDSMLEELREQTAKQDREARGVFWRHAFIMRRR